MRFADAPPGWLLPVAAAAAYLTALGGTFQFDDYNVIVDNPAVHGWAAWRQSMPGIRPLLKLSYTTNWQLAQATASGPLGFLLFNLLCHLLGALLVYALGRRWLPLLAPGLPQPQRAAWLAALLFALHPAQTEAVTYICGRSTGLMGLLYLAALWAYGFGGTPARRWLSAGLMVAALAAKETGWTAPLALLLLELGRGTHWATALRRLWPHWLALALAAVAAVTVTGYQRLLDGSLALRPPLDNLLAQVDGVFYLLTRPLLALQTNIDPDIPLTEPGPAFALKAALLLGLLLAGLWQLRRQPWLGVGLLWFFLHLLPTNSLLPRNDLANDRQLYLALIGPAWLAAVALYRWLPRPAPVAALLALALGTATAVRNLDYRSEVALWQATAARSPDKARVWNNLGYAHQQAGEPGAAAAAYRRALALEPHHVQARFNLQALDAAGPAASSAPRKQG